MPSSWLQLSVRADPAAFDAVSNFLIERGSPGVVIKKNGIEAYFNHSPNDGAIKTDVQRFVRAMNKLYPAREAPRLRWKILQDRNWNSSWRRFFVPQTIGRSFWVGPPWVDPPQASGAHVIVIEPGMAFGTGTHATTRGCLEFIDKAVRALRGSSFSALDVGTGSGILAIALAQLGAKKICAVDNDPIALKVACENIRSNGVETRVRLIDDLRKMRGTFSIVAANLTAETILQMARSLQSRVAPRGFLILSGILTPKTQEVSRAFRDARFKVVSRKREKEWATLLLRRQ